MPKGIWSENNMPVLPGSYNRFTSKAIEASTIGNHGVVGIPVKADWGEVGVVTPVNGYTSLKNSFGSNANLTAYKLGKLALDGSPKELVLYRMASSNAAYGSLDLKDSENNVIATLKTIYKSNRDFRITISENIEDSSKVNVYLYEGTVQLSSFEKVDNSVNGLVPLINKNFVKYVQITKAETATGTESFALVSQAALTGGNNGDSDILVSDYLEAISKFAEYGVDVVALDGVHDRNIQSACIEYLIDLEKQGQRIFIFVGGNGTPEEGNNFSKQNSKYKIVHNIINGMSVDGVQYTAAETAVHIATLAVSGNIKDCLAYKKIYAGHDVDVIPRMSTAQMIEATESGSMCLFIEDGIVQILDDKNTFTDYGDEYNDTFGYFRAMRFITTIDKDTLIKNRDLIGVNTDDETGRTAVLCEIKKYFEELQKQNVISEFVVEADDDLNANASNSQFFWIWSAKYINVIKQLFGTGHLI